MGWGGARNWPGRWSNLRLAVMAPSPLWRCVGFNVTSGHGMLTCQHCMRSLCGCRESLNLRVQATLRSHEAARERLAPPPGEAICCCGGRCAGPAAGAAQLRTAILHTSCWDALRLSSWLSGPCLRCHPRLKRPASIVGHTRGAAGTKPRAARTNGATKGNAAGVALAAPAGGGNSGS